ncbi:YcjX family protein [Rubellimicrobium aerolatum]|uniref:YcjX family protein n=1 Tax=Rubellimicrobium aerolatum TaxID=490979 RepID=A0ABW0SFZ9_9RHOB|nr:YcjX family protein [Rubellimicrobium aerolatum]MBP1805813.1 putative YcjX-like family ATPase [Rubellimicrobium aerolatum]
MIGSVTDSVWNATRNMAEAVAAPFQDPVIRLGVTGLSRAGKTVFITSLVANLMDRGRMPQLRAAADERILAAWLQPQPDDAVARFAFEDHLAALTAPEPHWPEGTRRVAELRLSLRLAPSGLLGGLSGPRTVHLDIVDYPGEWLLDLGLLDKDFASWSERALAKARTRPGAEEFLARLGRLDPGAGFDEVTLRGLAEAYAAHLQAARDAGFSDCTPGRFLLPGDLQGSPVLTFAPLPPVADAPRRSLWRESERRFEAYKRLVVKPFFREHFARIDRQVVLVDVLGALARGPRAFEDLREAMADILGVFNPGSSAWLARLLGQKRIDRILFAATKADHLHHGQHARLAALTEALLREARDRAEFAGADTAAMAIASLRTTVEDRVSHGGEMLDVVRGRLDGTGRQVAQHPGDLPEDPGRLLAPARAGAEDWPLQGYELREFAPAPLTLRPGEGPPHIRLDKAAEFLIGDRL